MEIAILLLAVVLRFSFLDIKPAHFDEGINGWFADGMKEKGFYHYDPTNYHGPLHFYAVFASQTVFGRSLFALRLPAILASLMCVWLALHYREFLGPVAARVAALAMAISPAFVFYGRYSIHESWQVLFSMLMLWAVLGLWQKGERRFLVACVGGFTGMVLTKETYIIHAGCLLLAAGTLWAWQLVVPSKPALKMAKQQWSWPDLGIAVAAGIFAIVVFYSGGFLDLFPVPSGPNAPAGGVKGLYETFFTWVNTGADAAGHAKKAYDLFGMQIDDYWLALNYYWLTLFARYEWPALAGFAFCLPLVWRTDARLRFIAIYGAGVLLAYSLIPYKTPWCIISIEWPFLLLFGVGIAWLHAWRKPVAWVVAAALLIGSFVLSIRLNFFHFTDEKEPYVYVQTYPEIAILTDPVLGLAKKDSRYYQLSGAILLDSYYPIPWIFGDFPRVGYYKDTKDLGRMKPDFIAAEQAKAEDVESKLSESYYKREFRLRDAMGPCIVYFRAAAFHDWFHDAPPEIVRP